MGEVGPLRRSNTADPNDRGEFQCADIVFTKLDCNVDWKFEVQLCYLMKGGGFLELESS